MELELGVHHFQHIKLGVHIAQAVVMFISWILCIAVFRSTAIVDGRLGWFFGMVRILLPQYSGVPNVAALRICADNVD
jgi:hypothetical protein